MSYSVLLCIVIICIHCVSVVLSLQQHQTPSLSTQINNIINNYNITLYNKYCESQYQQKQCHSLTLTFLNNITVHTLSEIDSLPYTLKSLYTSFHFNLAMIHYYGYLSSSPSLPSALEHLIISAYFGDPKSHYILYVLIQTNLLPQIITDPKYITKLTSNHILNAISLTPFYANINYTSTNTQLSTSIAFMFLYSSSLAHYPPALNALGYKYLNGYNTKQSCSIASEYYKQSAQLTINDITNRHSRNYYNYITLTEYEYITYKFNYRTKLHDELDYMKLKASNGNIDHIFTLYEKYLYGIGVEQNYNEAFYWINKGVKLNDSLSLFHLGEMYLNGWGTPINYTHAYLLFTQAANANVSQAYNSIGYMYYNGLYVEKNIKRAYDYFKKGTHNNDLDAYYDLMTLLIEDNGDIEVDINTAHKYSSLLASKAHTYGTYYSAMLNHYKLSSLMMNCNTNVKLYKLVAERNVLFKQLFDKAMQMYLNGQYKNALLMFIGLAEQGHTPSQLNAALLLKRYDIFIDKVYQKEMSVRYMMMNAEDDNGDVFAVLNMGEFYYKGFGNVKVDYDKARKFFEKVVKGGNLVMKGNALFNIGMMYSYGYGVERNVDKAVGYYNMSINTGTSAKYPAFIMMKYEQWWRNRTWTEIGRGVVNRVVDGVVGTKWKVWGYGVFVVFYCGFYVSLYLQRKSN